MVAKLSLVECMAVVEDPRVDRTKAHDLQDILVLSVLAVLCGADGWEDIELFADGDGDYVLARNRGQSPQDRVSLADTTLQWGRDLLVAESYWRMGRWQQQTGFNGAATCWSRKGTKLYAGFFVF